jgi:hypothetical protein|tara:strand:+ start:113 stop:289 length:177 start_codon:yes stop_codon:yes gene_type:complete
MLQHNKKTKEIKPKIEDNGEKKKPTKDEMIKQLETEIREIEKMYHQKTGALAYLKEID